MMSFLGVFLLTAVLDFVWARYTAHVGAARAIAASLYASFIFSVGGLVTVAYTVNHWLLVPAALGAFLGTYVAVRTNK
jgi:uncharacterized membrane protein YfcA